MEIKNLQIIISVFSLIFIGYFSKVKKIVDEDFARKAIKFLFYLPLPLLVFLSFASTQFDYSLAVYPVISIVISLILIALSYFTGKTLQFSNKTIGTLIAASGISATLVFALPFIQAFYGVENLKYLFMYDLGNGFMAWTIVYLITGSLGNKKEMGIKKGILSFMKNPMIFALVLGVIIGISGYQLPAPITNVKTTLSQFVNPLLFVSIGILLNFSYFLNKKNLVQLALSAGIIMGFSLLLAYIFTSIFAVSGIGQKVILIAAASPAAALAVAFSVEHDLDLPFASALVAFTMAIGIILIPIIILL